MVAGYTNSRGDNNYDFLLMQIDPNGNMIWNKTYGETGSQEASAMTKAPDGYVIVGDTQSPDSNIHAWVVKVDWNGTMLWAKTVGGKNADSPYFITPSEDGGYLVGGFTFSFGAVNRDFWLFKIDDSGQVTWSCIIPKEWRGLPRSLRRHPNWKKPICYGGVDRPAWATCLNRQGSIYVLYCKLQLSPRYQLVFKFTVYLLRPCSVCDFTGSFACGVKTSL